MKRNSYFLSSSCSSIANLSAAVNPGSVLVGHSDWMDASASAAAQDNAARRESALSSLADLVDRAHPSTPTSTTFGTHPLAQTPSLPRDQVSSAAPPVRYSLKDLRNMAAARAANARRTEEAAAGGLFYSPARERLSGVGEFRRSEYSARPLRWLDIGTLYDAITPHSFTPRYTPGVIAPPSPRFRPLPPTSPRTGLRRQRLFDEDGASAACPICLATFVPEGEQRQQDEEREEERKGRRAEHAPSRLPPPTLQWTSCCGRCFHTSCIAPLSRCPMCRCDLGLGLAREWTRLSPPIPLKAALELGVRGGL